MSLVPVTRTFDVPLDLSAMQDVLRATIRLYQQSPPAPVTAIAFAWVTHDRATVSIDADGKRYDIDVQFGTRKMTLSTKVESSMQMFIGIAVGLIQAEIEKSVKVWQETHR